MTDQKTFHRFVILLFLFTLIAGCGTDTPSSEEIAQTEFPVVRVVPSGAPPEKRELFVETHLQNNCQGTSEVTSVFEAEHSVAYTLEIGGEVTVSADGILGVPSVGQVQVGAEVAASYGVEYGQRETRTSSIELRAKAGTSVEHILRHIELWDSGTLMIGVADQQHSYPYHFRRGYRVELIDTVSLNCLLTPTSVPLTDMPATSTETPIPPTIPPAEMDTPAPAATETLVQFHPSTCQEIRDHDPNAFDGIHTLYLDGNKSAPYSVYCRNMVRNPVEYLPLVNTGDKQNYSMFDAGGARTGTDVVTQFFRIRIDPVTLEVDTADLTFATTTGFASGGRGETSQMNYASAGSCYSDKQTGTANIDLRGTPFALDNSSEFKGGGYIPKGNFTFSEDGKVADIWGGGYCGSFGATLLKLYYVGPAPTPVP
jgi:hypothetical protein